MSDHEERGQRGEDVEPRGRPGQGVELTCIFCHGPMTDTHIYTKHPMGYLRIVQNQLLVMHQMLQMHIEQHDKNKHKDDNNVDVGYDNNNENNGKKKRKRSKENSSNNNNNVDTDNNEDVGKQQKKMSCSNETGGQGNKENNGNQRQSTISDIIYTDKELMTWANQCEYQCRICQKMYNNRHSLLHHIPCIHKMNRKEYEKVQGAILTKEKKHICSVCRKQIKHSRESMKNHMKKMHDLDLADYFKVYIKGHSDANSGESSRIGKGVERAVIGSHRLKDAQHSPRRAEHRQLAEPRAKKVKKNPETTADDQSIIWSNRCEYKCQLCQKQCKNRNSLFHHVVYFHKHSLRKYKRRFGGMESRLQMHKCRICEKKVQHSRQSLREHLRAHQMTIHDYHKKFVVKRSSESKSYGNNGDGSIKQMAGASMESRKENRGEKEEERGKLSTKGEKKTINVAKKSTTATKSGEKKNGEKEEERGKLSKKLEKKTKKVAKKSTTATKSGEKKNGEKEEEREKLSRTVENKKVKDTETTSNADEVVEEAVSKTWMNGCIYSCRFCRENAKTFESRSLVRAHLIHAHNSHDLNQADVDLNYHICHICHDILIREQECITDHLRSEHDCSPQDYFQKYMS